MNTCAHYHLQWDFSVLLQLNFLLSFTSCAFQDIMRMIQHLSNLNLGLLKFACQNYTLRYQNSYLLFQGPSQNRKKKMLTTIPPFHLSPYKPQQSQDKGGKRATAAVGCPQFWTGEVSWNVQPSPPPILKHPSRSNIQSRSPIKRRI